jgi:hypothetical protein
MKPVMLSAVVVLAAGNAATAGDAYAYSIRDYRPFCRARVTEICKVPAPVNLGMPKVLDQGTDVRARQQTTLQCRDWQGGRVFTDQTGRRWELGSPVPLRQPPQQLTGNIFTGMDGRSLFMTTDQLIFVELPKQ